ncbi:MAG: amino acid adenylation domain-containing protein, partial [Methylovulum miyakonense]|uniref:amino acid adenylation domain-containing protein n=1 Tax=Methylovulum miyakonense TaxID=645578 RepID=UPI003BB6838F
MQDAIATPLDAAQQKRARLISKLTQNNAPVNSISRRENPGIAPLSYGQEALWLMSHLEPDNPIYNVAGALEFNGRLNIAALQQSLDEVVRRHEILRSRFGSEQGTVIQRVDDGCQLSLRLLDLDNVDAAQTDGCFQRCADEFIRTPFDLNNAAPLRAMLLKLAGQRHILVLALHHIVADRWSVGILMREVAGLYRQFGSGLPSTLPELGINYGDFAAWQRQQGGLLPNHQDYWQQKLQGLPPLLALPTDYPRPATLSYRGDLYHFALSPELSLAINQLAKQYNATLFMVMAAALQVLLHRYTGSDDIAIGYTVAGRTQSQVSDLIGFFVNTLVLRGQWDDDDGFADLLAKTRSQALDDQAHQDIAFGQLLEAVNPVRNSSYAPLFQVMLTVQNAPRVDFSLPGLEVTPVRLASKAAQFDLTFLFEEQDGGLQGTIEYSTDLFAAATLARLAGHLQTLLAAMVANPELALKQLPMLTPAEWQQMVVDWNTSESVSDDVLSQPLPQQFAKQAQVTPDHMALVFAGEKLSYRELDQRANDLAHTLHDLGIKPESRVGVCAERSADLVVALLAVLKAGAAYLPLDPSYPQERLDFMVKDAAVALLLVQTAFADRFQKLLCPIVSIKQNATAREPLVCPAGLDNTAYLIYTSGSSGQPKGVAVSHRNLLHSTLARSEYYREAPDAFLLLSSFAFDSSVAGIFWTLSQGGCLCLPQTADTTNPNALAKLIQSHQVSHVLALPSFYAALISEVNLPLLTNLKIVIVAGEACTGELANDHHRKLPQVKFFNEYGPTEGTVWSSVYHSETSEATGTLTLGRAIDRVQMYILDQHGEPVPMGVSGELCIAGAGIAQGYINRPDLTAEKFIPNPFGVAGGRLYKTGDLAKFRADGNIEFLGRIDHQVKIRGFRIELGEIEARLTGFPYVRAAVVLAREDSSGDKRLVAYLLADVEPSISDLREHLSVVLPDYMIPGAFVRLAEFPLTPNGKLDRRALPEPDRAAVATQDYAAPQTLAETVLAELWQALLGVDKVGRDDHFFELGGHSLMAISLVERLQQQGFSAEVMNVFTMPVLSEMAATLVADVPTTNAVAFGAIPEGSTVITPELLPLVTLTQEAIDALSAEVPGGIANIQDIYPLAPLQDGILFHHLLATDSDAYLKRSLLRFATRERLDSFLAALQIVIDRHDILRTAIHWQGLPHAVQVVQRHAQLPIIHLSVEAGADALQTLQEQTELSRLRMDLQQAPLFVAYILFDPIADHCLLALVNHHLIDDNYTLQLILSEINQIFLGQGDQLLPPLPYRHFIAQVISVPETEHEAYFRSQLGDIDAPTAPFGVLDIQGNGSQINEAHLVLDDSLAQRLYGTARQQGVTVAVLCHVAWAQVLAQCTGRDDVVFGTVLSGRLQTQTGASQALGVFINTLPIRLSLDGYGVRQIVADCYSRLGGLLDHEHAALALAQRCSGVAAGLPLFTTLLNYRHSNLIAENSTGLFAWQGIELLATEERTNYPVTLCIDDLGEGIRITAQCVQAIDAVRIAAYFETALDKLTGALQQTPDFRVCQLSILPDSERQHLLQGGNAHPATYPAQPCLHQRFEAQAANAPNAIALSYEGQTLSYGGLNRQANRLAHALIAHGVRPDQLVALCAERGIDLVIGLLAIHKAGGAYLPLDPGYPDERLAYLLADSRPV